MIYSKPVVLLSKCASHHHIDTYMDTAVPLLSSAHTKNLHCMFPCRLSLTAAAVDLSFFCLSFTGASPLPVLSVSLGGVSPAAHIPETWDTGHIYQSSVVLAHTAVECSLPTSLSWSYKRLVLAASEVHSSIPSLNLSCVRLALQEGCWRGAAAKERERVLFSSCCCCEV